MHFEIIGEITDIEPIAVGRSIRDLARLRRQYGPGRWRKLKGIALVRLTMDGYAVPSSTGTKPMVLERKKSNASDMWIKTMNYADQSRPQFVVCMNNAEYPASLELYKIYRVLPDEDAEQDGDLRVIDESGEDYLYPAEYFMMLDLPREVQRALLQAT